jgi:hypothetical protein
MGFKSFPRFFYSDSKNENSIGPVIIHLNYPRAFFTVTFTDVPNIKFHSCIDKADQERLERLTDEAKSWANNYFNS